MANSKIMMADTINRFAKDYEQMVKAAEFLKEIGTNEQIADELKAAAEAARKDADAAQHELANAKEAVKHQKLKCTEMIADADHQAAYLIERATVEAGRVTDDAKNQAESIIEAAREMADKATAGVNATIRSLEAVKADLLNDIHQAEAELEAKTVLAKDIEARLAKAQAQIAKLLG